MKKVPPKIYRYEWNATASRYDGAEGVTESLGPRRSAASASQKKGIGLKGEYAGSGETSLLHAWKKQRHLEDVRREALKADAAEKSSRAERAGRRGSRDEKPDDQSLPSVSRSEGSERRRRKSKSIASEADDDSSVAVSVAVARLRRSIEKH